MKYFDVSIVKYICIAAAAVSLCTLIFGNVFVAPALLEYAEKRIRSMASLALSDAIAESFSAAVYDDLFEIGTDTENNVKYIKSNSLAINSIANEVSTLAIEKLNEKIDGGVTVNTGSAFSITTAGWGPDVTVYVQPVGAAVTEFDSKFDAGGVNQTRHRLYINISAEVYAATGMVSRTFEVRDSVLLCENIIVGTVPEYYVDVNNEEDMLNLLP